MPEVDFISLNVEVPCPVCGEKLHNFETKEGPGVGVSLDFKEVDSFYSHCTKCNSIIEFSLKSPVAEGARAKLTLDSYNRKTEIY